ncbi:condensation domain-containing protein [Frankia canadensis]|uniref:condensation domain-containing protein n=1 Tax=Frankia canadensis TaxID=1836972 RepID=UPI001FAF9831|nr:condensation domain-containing protein [Frankia canadensis]
MLTPGEQILAASDRASAPLTCGLLVQIDGRLDPDQLRSAVWAVIRRHPMARAVLYGSRQHAWRFAAEPTADPFGFVDDGTDGWRVQELLSSAPFDLRRYPPLRVALVRRPEGDQLCVVAHHLAFDGLRLAALVTEILDHYRHPSDEHHPSDGPRPAGGTVRGMPAGMSAVVRSGAPGWSALVRRSGRYITPLTLGRGDGYGFHPMVLPAPSGGRTLPDGRHMTVNDLLLGAAHLAVDRWNARRGGETGRLRIRMPVDLVTAPSFAASASSSSFPGPAEISGNRTGQTIIMSEAAERADPVRLAGRVVEQTCQAKQVVPPPVPGVSGALGIAAARFVPGPWRSTLLRLGVAAGRPLLAPTAAVSNLGRHDAVAGPIGTAAPRAGSGRLLVAVGSGGLVAGTGPAVTAVYFTGTAGMPQGLFIGVLGMGDRLNVTFGHHRQLFGPGSVPAFADLFRASFAELVEIGSAGSATPPASAPPSVASPRSASPAPASEPAAAPARRPERSRFSPAADQRRGTVPTR